MRWKVTDAEKKAVAKIRRWRQDPVFFVQDQFGVEPDEWQKEVLESFADPDKQRILMKACAGPGKSAVLAWCGWNFLSCYGALGEHPKGAVVSVTADNLRDNLWPELAKWQGRSPFLSKMFTWTKERIFSNQHPETWFLSARTFSKTANSEEQGRTLSGLHSKFILFLIDESGDISPAVLRSAEQGLSNTTFGKILQAGNPTSLEGMLYHAATHQRDRWLVVTITGDPDDARRSNRVDKEWAREQIALHGRENPWVMAYILGQFPPASINSLLSIDEVEASMNRFVSEDKFDYSQKRLGVDVARFGDDRTSIFPRQGLISYAPVNMRNARSYDIAGRIAKAIERWGAEIVCIDVTGGFGSGVEDALVQAGVNVHPVDFGGKATDSRYFNKRSEIWFTMAEWVKRGGALPPVPGLVRELTAPTYSFQNGKFRLEEKDQIKKRLQFSPDDADALACTFALPDMPRRDEVASRFGLDASGKMKAEYDPFSEERMSV